MSPLLLRRTLLLAAAAASTSLLAACNSRDAVAEGPINLKGGVPVGAVLALTGNANVYGQHQRVGLNLALAAVNGSGGINGTPLRLAIEDSGSDDPGANTAMTLQINRGMLAIIGPTLSQQAFAADPIAQRQVQTHTLVLAVDVGVAAQGQDGPDRYAALEVDRCAGALVTLAAGGQQTGATDQAREEQAQAPQHQATSAKLSRKAAIVASMSSSLWAREVKPASKALGAR